MTSTIHRAAQCPRTSVATAACRGRGGRQCRPQPDADERRHVRASPAPGRNGAYSAEDRSSGSARGGDRGAVSRRPRDRARRHVRASRWRPPGFPRSSSTSPRPTMAGCRLDPATALSGGCARPPGGSCGATHEAQVPVEERGVRRKARSPRRTRRGLVETSSVGRRLAAAMRPWNRASFSASIRRRRSPRLASAASAASNRPARRRSGCRKQRLAAAGERRAVPRSLRMAPSKRAVASFALPCASRA